MNANTGEPLNAQERTAIGCFLVGLCAAVVVFLVIAQLVQPQNPNPKLVETARRAIEMADAARKDAQSARRAGSALRALALAAGITVPLLVVYLIYRLEARAEPRWEEVVGKLAEENQQEPPAPAPPELKEGAEADRRQISG